MPLRLLEVVGRWDAVRSVPDILEDVGVLETWLTRGEDGTGSLRILAPAERSEAITDRLGRHLGDETRFRVVLLPVEAAIPAPSEAGEGAAGDASADAAPSSRISREELYQDISGSARVTPVYLGTVALSTIVASVGLVRGDVAVIVGAMVIAPLLGPNVALSLAATLGDGRLARRALAATGAGAATALVLSMMMGWAVPVDPTVPELAARSQAGLGDVALALAAGSAGALAYTTGLPSAVIGVMVAVALLPPLVAAGLLAGSGHPVPAAGAFFLVLTNVVCVNLAGVATFLVQRVRPRTWWEAERAQRATRLAMASWLVMLLVLIGILVMLEA